jgi:pimeloyl-ACP methyl ester carboxylesterase
MTPSFARSTDGARIAYDATGTGPALILLHGGGQTRRVWHEAGYVARLRDEFTVITIDIRGNGQSDKPTDAGAYAIDHLCDDVLAVADATRAARVSVWGYSYGGNIGRYLPARSNRVIKLVILGIPFGAAAPGPFREYALSLRTKWTPVIKADRAGRLDLTSLSEQDRALWQAGNVPLTVAQLSAILDWPPVEPADLRCSTLWLVGEANEHAMPSVHEYRDRLARTTVVLQIVPGLDHAGELTNVERVLAPLVAFTR